MSQPLKQILKKRVSSVVDDQEKLYIQLHGIIMQVFHVCMARDIVKEYRYLSASRLKEYNSINSFSHVALENFAILQIWKLFDRRSTLNVYSVVDKMPHFDLKKWFEVEIEKIREDIDYIAAWRGNFVGHRSEIAQFAPEEFEKKFKDIRDSEPRVKEFLLYLLCRTKFEMYKTETHETMEELVSELKGFAELLQRDKDKVLKGVN